MCTDLQLIAAGTEMTVLWGPRWLMWFYLAAAQHHTAIHSLCMKWDEGETWKQNRTGGVEIRTIY